MRRRITIQSEDEEEERDELKKALKELEKDVSVKRFFQDVLEGNLSKTWKDLEAIVSEIFNSKSMAKIYLLLLREPGRSLKEVSERLNYTKEKASRTLKRLLKLDYISVKVGNHGAGEEAVSIYFARPPEEVVKKIASSIEKKMMALASADSILLKKAKKYSLIPIKIVVGEKNNEEKRADS